MLIKIIKEGIHDDHCPESGPIVNKISAICSTVVLLKAEKEGEKNMLIDTGNIGFEDEIIDGLKKEGLTPEDIEIIINTHRHHDHAHNNYLFRNAERIIGKGIWKPDGTLDVYKKPEDISVPGVEIIQTPGHLEGHVSVIVESEGKKTVIAGDALVPEYIDQLDETGKKSALKIMGLADRVIPGHGDMIEKDELEDIRRKLE